MFLRGFYPPPIWMEEESEPRGSGFPLNRRPITIRTTGDVDKGEEEIETAAQARFSVDDFLATLMRERQTILNDSKLSPKDKVRLLDTGRYPLSIATGRGILFKSEEVVYAILAFSLVVLVVLAILTAYAGLPKDVTIAFVGTVVGGTTATIAQKLGKV